MLPPELVRIVKLTGKKKRQHYVFQRYLSAWATDGSLWVRRHDGDKIFRAKTENVAVESYYYKLQSVTDEDVALVRLLLLERVPFYVKERCELLIHNLTVPLLLKEAIDPANPNLNVISDGRVTKGAVKESEKPLPQEAVTKSRACRFPDRMSSRMRPDPSRDTGSASEGTIVSRQNQSLRFMAGEEKAVTDFRKTFFLSFQRLPDPKLL